MAMLSFCGIDVSKDRLDVVVLPEGWFFSVSNDTAGCAELVVRLRPLAVSAIGLFAAAVSALERRGIGEPGRHLALVRSWNTTTLLVKNGPLTGEDVAAIRRFAEERAFDLGFLRGMSREEANRFNILDQHYFFDSTVALLGVRRCSIGATPCWWRRSCKRRCWPWS